MFGLWRPKCRRCGTKLDSADRTDDLMSGSAVGAQKFAKRLCARCRVIVGIDQPRPEPLASPPAPPPPPPAPPPPPPLPPSAPAELELATVATPIDEKTESELEAERNNEDNVIASVNADGAGGCLIWLLTTKAGLNLAAVTLILSIIGLSNCLGDDDYQPVDQPVATNAPSYPIDTAPPAVQPETAPETATAEPEATSPAPAQPPAVLPARPSNNPGSWVVTNDYPSRALAQERQGTTGFRLSVNAKGRVTACQITKSSGHADLDAATCSALKRRARFEPVTDGAADRSYRNRVTWRIPKE
jgi:TonB family protein